MPHQRLTDQVLLIDADDTLWENQAWFDRALAEFDSVTARLGLDRKLAHHTLREEERVRVPREGYGSRRFARSLVTTLELLGQSLDAEIRSELQAIGDDIFDHPVDPFPAVLPTLQALSQRHRLFCVTKGDPDEQLPKIARSGLEPLFEETVVLVHKTPEQYRQLVHDRELNPTKTWMIGNSPRSDINPAREAGLQTIYIPHHSLWEHEAAPLHPAHELTLDSFAALTRVL